MIVLSAVEIRNAITVTCSVKVELCLHEPWLYEGERTVCTHNSMRGSALCVLCVPTTLWGGAHCVYPQLYEGERTVCTVCTHNSMRGSVLCVLCVPTTPWGGAHCVYCVYPQLYEGERTVCTHNSMRGSALCVLCVPTRIRNPTDRRKWLVIFTIGLLYPRGKNSWCPLNIEAGWTPQTTWAIHWYSECHFPTENRTLIIWLVT
jgi:hypothetical protein